MALGTYCGHRHLVNGKCPTSFVVLPKEQNFLVCPLYGITFSLSENYRSELAGIHFQCRRAIGNTTLVRFQKQLKFRFSVKHSHMLLIYLSICLALGLDCNNFALELFLLLRHRRNNGTIEYCFLPAHDL